jgi:hypothetical protein
VDADEATKAALLVLLGLLPLAVPEAELPPLWDDAALVGVALAALKVNNECRITRKDMGIEHTSLNLLQKYHYQLQCQCQLRCQSQSQSHCR